MANAVVRGSLISVGLAGALCALAAQAAGDSFVVPGSKAAAQKNCVEPVDYMRRNHMEVIKHQRDATVHDGVRATNHSLAGCIECHVGYGSGGAPLPVNKEDQFCGACHNFTAVHLNCFDCHSTIPSAAPMRASLPGQVGQFAWLPPVGGDGFRMQVPQPEVGGEGN